MHRLVLLLSATAMACSGPTHEISARGFSTVVKNHALSRTTAENRAIAELQELLEPDGVSFTLKRVGAASVLEVAKPATQAAYKRVEMLPLDNGWMATAFAERKPEVAEAMAKLPAVEARATVAAPVLEMAAEVAKSRALGQLIEPMATGDGVFTGTVTLVELEYGFETGPGTPETEAGETEAEPPGESAAADPATADAPAEAPVAEEAPDTATPETAPGDAETEATTEGDVPTDGDAPADAPADGGAPTEGEPEAAPLHTVTVTLRGVAKAERTGETTDDDKIAVERSAAIEHFRLREWKESAEITTALLELTPQSLPFVLLKAAAQFHQGEVAPATETLSLAIMEGGGPDSELVTTAFAEVSKTVGADNITPLAKALEEQKAAAASAAEKSKKKKRKKKRKK